jgi:N-acetyl-gamma-glutamyl-phosphate reductase
MFRRRRRRTPAGRDAPKRSGGRREKMAYKVFIDGQEGTTGLQIHDRLRGRTDIELLQIPEELRKDPAAKLELYRQSDVSILCLPDAASREAFETVKGGTARIIDASTAFRTAPGWVYGLPELSPDQRSSIRGAQFVSNCGCYAAGFILALRPLVTAGAVSIDYPVTCHAVSGYSGGGKRLIQTHEGSGSILPARPYAFGLRHKHVPEMQKYTGLTYAPLFAPLVGHFYQGMIVSVPLFPRLLTKPNTPREVREVLADYYRGEPFITVAPFDNETGLEEGFLSPTACNDTNRLDLFVFGHEEQMLVAARFDNLGKGASGTAVQNMNIMLGVEETTGLTEGLADERSSLRSRSQPS